MPSTDPTPQQDPPSSPLPTEPTPLTPGPRAQAFLNLYNSALDNTLKSISYTSFSSCFPTISKNAEPALKAMHSGMIGRLGDFAREEFEEILRERRVVERVNGLEVIVGKARGGMVGSGDQGEVVAPHTLPPTLLIKAHTLPLHIAQNSQLNARLQTTQSQNAKLMEDIRQQRKEIEELMVLLETGVKDVGGAGEVLGGKVGGLSQDAREAGEVLNGT